jgi:hypothetical protein
MTTITIPRPGDRVVPKGRKLPGTVLVVYSDGKEAKVRWDTRPRPTNQMWPVKDLEVLS